MVSEPNQLHNIDFKGQFRTRDAQWCYPLTLTDTFSRSLLVCQGLLRPTYLDTRAALERAFREYGLPDGIRSDNGEPFVSSQSLAGLSRFGVWLIKLGVERIRTRPGSPQDNGLHERMHRTLKEETAIPPAANRSAQQRIGSVESTTRSGHTVPWTAGRLPRAIRHRLGKCPIVSQRSSTRGI